MKTRILLSAAMLATAALASAQLTNTGYFLENYNYRYQLNPAFGNDLNFVSMPAFGNINLAMRGNTHLTNFFHNVDGQTMLFTNPEVPASVLNDFPTVTRFSTDFTMNVLSGGFKAWGGYNTISINAKTGLGLSVPRTFFELAKEGVSNRTYDISDLSANAFGYAEIALNHSREIKQVPGLRVGAAIKFLLGVANIEADFRKADLTLGTDAWTATADADIYANLGGMQFETELNDEGKPYVSGANMDGDGSIGINGFGMAFDLGASYQWRDFNFSVGVLDLGWITYHDTQNASTNGERTFTTDAYTFNVNEDAENNFDDEFERMGNELDKLYQLDNNGNIGNHNVTLGATLNVGIDYAFPFYRNLHFGVLSSSRFMKNFNWTEVRISANVAPVKWFSADVNYAYGTYGSAFGWMVNFYNKGIIFFLGMDNTPVKLAKQGVPLNSNISFNAGLGFAF